MADARGLCHAKHDEEVFCGHLEDKEACIYPKLTLGYDDLMEEIERKYSIKAVLVFREKDITFLRIFHMIFFKAGQRPT